MPYRLRKAPNRDLYWVVGEDGTKHSKEPIPKERAEAQRRALYANVKEGGVSISKPDFIKEHKNLIKILKKGTKAQQLKEAQDQSEELSKELKGGTHREDFLKKHKLEDKGYSLEELAKISGEPLATLQQVYNRGIGAHKTNGLSVRMKGSFKKGVKAPMSKKLSKEQWAFGRTYSYLMNGHSQDDDLRGGGVFGDLFKFGKKVSYNIFHPLAPVKNYLTVGSKLGKLATAIATPKKYNPTSLKFLQENGEALITSMSVRRAPVAKGINTALQLITLGQWNQSKEKLGYDNMFHLSIIVELRMPDGSIRKGLMEKLATLNFTNTLDSPEGAEYKVVPLVKPLVLLPTVNKTQEQMGADYFKYSAFNNNCQTFVGNYLMANGLMTDELRGFIYQDVETLLQEQPGFLGDFADTITNLGGIADRITKGYGKANHPRMRPMMKGGIKLIIHEA